MFGLTQAQQRTLIYFNLKTISSVSVIEKSIHKVENSFTLKHLFNHFKHDAPLISEPVKNV